MSINRHWGADMNFVWILEDSGSPVYTPADVRTFTGASAIDLQNWANRGYVKPVADKPGKGGTRLYNKVQVCAIRLAKWMLPLGIDASSAMMISTGALKRYVNAISDKIGEEGVTRHEVIKFTINAAALVKAGPSDDAVQIIIRDITKTKKDEICAHVLDLEPGFIIPIGLLIGQVARLDQTSEVGEHDDKERPTVKASRR